MSVLINLLMLTGPIYMLQIYDRVLSSKSVPTLIALSLLMVGLFVCMWFFDRVRSRIATRIGIEIDRELNGRAFSAWLNQGRFGAIAKRHKPLNDLGHVRGFLSGPGPTTIFDLPWIPIYVGVIFVLHWTLGVIAVIGTIVIIVAAILNELTTRKPLEDSNKSRRESMEVAETAFRNADVVNALGMEHAVQERWLDQNQEYSKAVLKSGDRANEFSVFSKSFRLGLQSGILGAGAALAIVQIITPGTMIAASIIMGRALAPVQSALSHWRGYAQARQAYERLDEFFLMFPTGEPLAKLPPPIGRLEVENLHAAPPGSQTPTLMGLEFDLKPGQGLGVIGPAASGKSTLARLLVGLWMPFSGSVRLDGATLDQWAPEDLGPHIGYLPQRVELLHGTIGENISRFTAMPDSEAMMKAAKQAGVHELILKMEKGYDTLVDVNGTSLSGGQIQRIALARALYGDPAFVVLDEPNANLDVDGDAALASAIKDLRDQNKTVVVMTHRPSVLASLDMVLMLSEGKQIAFKPRDEVLGAASNPKLIEPVKRITSRRGRNKPFAVV